VGLGIPGIGVHTDLIALGLNPDGTIMVPPLDSADAEPAADLTALVHPGARTREAVLG